MIDPVSTSCASLSLPTLPSPYQYHCSTSTSNAQKTDGTGWIPVNFTQISIGSPLSRLPLDPVNETSTGEYYTYIPGGSWELTAMFSSQKYQEIAINDGDAFPGVYSIRTSPKPLTPGIRDKGLVGYWSFDEGSGTIAYDRSGKGNNGTLINGPSWQSPSNCIKGGCLSFDGVDDYINVSNVIPAPVESITVMAFIKSASSTGYTGVFQIVSNYNSYILGSVGSMRMSFIIHNGTNWYDYGNYVYVSNPASWNFFAGTYDSFKNLENLYMNGGLVSTKTVYGSIQFGGQLHIAHRESSGIGSDHFFGLIDEVRIYNRALSDAEIKAIYEATR